MDGEGLEITGKLFVAIAYQKGVIMCEQWDPNTPFLGIHYKEFAKKTFSYCF